MSEYLASRLAAIDPRHLVVACQAIISRLRRIHDRANGGDLSEETKEKLRGAHTENVEALLNLLSVLEADPKARASDVRGLRGGLEAALESARGARSF